MSSLRARAIRLAHNSPDLRPHLLPLLTDTNPLWQRAAEQARQATLAALPPCRCMGPEVSIFDYGRGPIMDVSYGHDITPEEIKMMDRAVSGLGWRGWGYGTRGIAFKPTSVDLGEGY